MYTVITLGTASRLDQEDCGGTNVLDVLEFVDRRKSQIQTWEGVSPMEGTGKRLLTDDQDPSTSLSLSLHSFEGDIVNTECAALTCLVTVCLSILPCWVAGEAEG